MSLCAMLFDKQARSARAVCPSDYAPEKHLKILSKSIKDQE